MSVFLSVWSCGETRPQPNSKAKSSTFRDLNWLSDGEVVAKLGTSEIKPNNKNICRIQWKFFSFLPKRLQLEKCSRNSSSVHFDAFISWQSQDADSTGLSWSPSWNASAFPWEAAAEVRTTRVLCVNGNLEGHSIIPKVKGSQLGQFFSLSASALSFHYSSRAQAAKEGLVLVLLSAAAFKKVFLWNFVTHSKDQTDTRNMLMRVHIRTSPFSSTWLMFSEVSLDFICHCHD